MTSTTETRPTSKVKIAAASGGAALLGAAITAALIIGPGTAPQDQMGPSVKSDQAPLGNSKDYSLTQTITNNSSQALTVSKWWVDNGGIITQTEPSVAAHDSQIYIATNHGNGVQMALTFSAPNGQVVYVDTDVPKVLGNVTKATITGKATGTGLTISDMSASHGDNAKAEIVLEDTGKDCTTTAEFPQEFVG